MAKKRRKVVNPSEKLANFSTTKPGDTVGGGGKEVTDDYGNVVPGVSTLRSQTGEVRQTAPTATSIGRLTNSEINTDEIDDTGMSLGARMAARGQVYFPGAGRGTGRISPRIPHRLSMRDQILESNPETAIGMGTTQGMLFHPDYIDELEIKAAGAPPLRESSKGGIVPTVGSVSLAHQELDEAAGRISEDQGARVEKAAKAKAAHKKNPTASSKSKMQKANKEAKALSEEELNIRGMGGAIRDAKIKSLQTVQDLFRAGPQYIEPTQKPATAANPNPRPVTENDIAKAQETHRLRQITHEQKLRELVGPEIGPVNRKDVFLQAHGRELLTQAFDPEIEPTFYPGSSQEQMRDVAREEGVHPMSVRSVVGATSAQRSWRKTVGAGQEHEHTVYPNLDAAEASINKVQAIASDYPDRSDEGFIEASARATAGTKGVSGGLQGLHGKSTARILRGELASGQFDPSAIEEYWSGVDRDKQATFTLALAANAAGDEDLQGRVSKPNKGLARSSAQAMTVDTHQVRPMGFSYEQALGTGEGMHSRAFGMLGNQPGTSAQPHYGTIANIGTAATHKIAQRMYDKDHAWLRYSPDEDAGGNIIPFPHNPTINPLPTPRDVQENLWGSYAADVAGDIAAARSAGVSERQPSREYYKRLNDTSKRINTVRSRKEEFGQ